MAGNERIDKEKMILRDGYYYSPKMDFANKQLAMYLSVAMQKVMEENQQEVFYGNTHDNIPWEAY